MKDGEIFTATCENWASDGAAVARVDGQVVFVKGGLPGETCEIVIEHVGHRAAWARIGKVLTPSPHRISADCPHYPACGGCRLRHMDYEAELDFKSAKVTDALRRIGGLDVEKVPVLGARSLERYRNKAQFPVAAGPKIGFYGGGSHRVIDVPDCLLQPQAASRLRSAVKEWMARRGVTAYDERRHVGLVRHVYVRTNSLGQALCCLVVNSYVDRPLPFEGELADALRAAEPGLVGVALCGNTKKGNVILGDSYRRVWGQDWLMDTLCGLDFKLSVPSFYQINHQQTEVLYGLVGQFCELSGQETVLDLYCGAGTIGLTLADRAKTLIGVELVPQAVENARENAERNCLRNCAFYAGDASWAAQKFAQEGTKIDVAIVDPPRKGLSPEVIENLLKISPQKLIYVSCDPATLARDLKELTKSYRLEKVQSVDLFPRTEHVETVCKLERI